MASYSKSLKLVVKHLDNDETIKESVYGAFETKRMGGNSVRNGVFVATEKRLFFFGKKTFGFETESFPFKNISSIESSKGLMGRSISIFASNNKAKMKWINKGDVNAFVNYVNEMINPSSSNNNVQKDENDILTQIEKLSALKEKGIITEEEFTAKKTDLLSKL